MYYFFFPFIYFQLHLLSVFCFNLFYLFFSPDIFCIFLTLCLFVCLHVRLYLVVRLFVFLSPSVRLSMFVRLFVFLCSGLSFSPSSSVCLSVTLSVHLRLLLSSYPSWLAFIFLSPFICSLIYLSLSICLPICLLISSIYMSYLSVCLFSLYTFIFHVSRRPNPVFLFIGLSTCYLLVDVT